MKPNTFSFSASLCATILLVISPEAVPQTPAPQAKLFRLRFNAYDGNPKEPEKMTFQVNTLDLRQPTSFLKLGEMIPNTNLRLEKFEEEIRSGAKTEDENLSKLTLINTVTKESVVLMLNTAYNLPAARKAP